MQAKPGVIALLNRHLSVELTAINQYFLDSEICHHWGYERLYAKFRALSMEEVEDAQRIMAYILFLDGQPNMPCLREIHVGACVEEMLTAGLQTESATLASLAQGIDHCNQIDDSSTRRMLEQMAAEEEHHVHWFAMQIEAIRQVGIDRWLAAQVH